MIKREIRDKREALRKYFTSLNELAHKVEFEKIQELKKEERRIYKKWSFYDGVLKAIQK